MQTMTAPTMLALLSIASGFAATGYTTRAVRPNGIVMVSGSAILVLRTLSHKTA